MVVTEAATGRKINYENIMFSSRIERFKWIRQFKKDHPNAKIKKYKFPKKGNIWTWPYGAEAKWELENDD